MQSHHHSAKPSLDPAEREKRRKDFLKKADILLSDPERASLLIGQEKISIKSLLSAPYDVFKKLFDEVDTVSLNGLVVLHQVGLSFVTVMQLDVLVRDSLLENAEYAVLLLKAGLPPTVFEREFAFLSCLSGNLKVIANAIQAELLTGQWLKDTLHMQISVLQEHLEELWKEAATPRGQSFVASLDFAEPGPSPAVTLRVFSMLNPESQTLCVPTTELIKPTGLGRRGRERG
jgi:hypothetical protein